MDASPHRRLQEGLRAAEPRSEPADRGDRPPEAVSAQASGARLPARCDAFEALATRRSVRAFRPDAPVDRATLEQILALAARAPSGSNLQPWKVHVLTGPARARLCARVMQAHDDGGAGHEEEYA